MTTFVDSNYNSVGAALAALESLVKSLPKLDKRPELPGADVHFDAAEFSRVVNVLRQHIPNQFPPSQAPQYAADTQNTQVDATLRKFAKLLSEFRDRTQRPVEPVFKSVVSYADFNEYCKTETATNDAEAGPSSTPARLAH